MQSMQCPIGRPPGGAGAMMRPFGMLLCELLAREVPEEPEVERAAGRVTHPFGTPGARHSALAFASTDTP